MNKDTTYTTVENFRTQNRYKGVELCPNDLIKIGNRFFKFTQFKDVNSVEGKETQTELAKLEEANEQGTLLTDPKALQYVEGKLNQVNSDSDIEEINTAINKQTEEPQAENPAQIGDLSAEQQLQLQRQLLQKIQEKETALRTVTNEISSLQYEAIKQLNLKYQARLKLIQLTAQRKSNPEDQTIQREEEEAETQFSQADEQLAQLLKQIEEKEAAELSNAFDEYERAVNEAQAQGVAHNNLSMAITSIMTSYREKIKLIQQIHEAELEAHANQLSTVQLTAQIKAIEEEAMRGVEEAQTKIDDLQAQLQRASQNLQSRQIALETAVRAKDEYINGNENVKQIVNLGKFIQKYKNTQDTDEQKQLIQQIKQSLTGLGVNEIPKDTNLIEYATRYVEESLNGDEEFLRLAQAITHAKQQLEAEQARVVQFNEQLEAAQTKLGEATQKQSQLQTKLDEANQQAQQTQQKITQLMQDKAALDGKIAQLKADIQGKDNKISDLQGQIHAGTGNSQGAQDRIQDLTDRVAHLTGELQTEKDKISSVQGEAKSAKAEAKKAKDAQKAAEDNANGKQTWIYISSGFAGLFAGIAGYLGFRTPQQAPAGYSQQSMVAGGNGQNPFLPNDTN